MKSNYKPIGDFIRLVDERNKDLEVSTLLGISISKKFIPSVANTVGTEMKRYKIIKKNQFACSLMQVRRDGKIPVALLTEFDEAIISQAYPVFELIDENELLPEYLMMWMSRSEFDREACFLAVGGVRGSLEWDDFCEMQLPIPDPEKQREIVREYNTVVDRIKLNEQLNKKMEETAQAIYRQWFEEFEFPDENGKPYKSSGGEMVWCEELEKDVPRDWEVKIVGSFCAEMKNGATPNRSTPEYWNSRDIPWLKTGEIKNNIVIEAEEYISKNGFDRSSTKLLPEDSVLMAMYGATAGQLAYLKFETTTNQACCAMICDSKAKSSFLYYYLLANQLNIKNLANGGAQENLSKDIIENQVILCPPEKIINNTNFSRLIENRSKKTKENKSLRKLKNILLSKMATT